MKQMTIIIWLTLLAGVFAGETTLILKDFPEKAVVVKGFHLNDDTIVRIEALGAGEHIPHVKLKNYFLDPSGMFAYGWIVNTQTREVVWRMTVDNTEKAGSGFLRKFEGNIELPAGDYEVYFSTATASIVFRKGFFSFGDILDYLFEGKNWYKEGLKKWYISVNNVDRIIPEKELQKNWEKLKKEAIFSVTQLKANDLKEIQFEVTRAVPIEIYAIGEGLDGRMYDYSKIVNQKTGDVFWEMKEWDTDHAGGALKNRMIRKNLTIPVGKYSLQVLQDDTHFPGDWNANPPFDPYFYGITIWANKPGDKKYIKQIHDQDIKALIAITRVGDNAFIEKAFKVKKKSTFRITALGEGSRNKMYDYGWIEDAETGDKIWVMEYDETRPAGGASKNRIVDTQIILMPGTYILGYRSDDSHSYNAWNASPPYNPTLWGISLYPFDQEAVTLINSNVPLESKWDVQIIKVGDDQHRFKKFVLKKLSKISIYAIGEGDDDEMFDYAWIENLKTHKIEWKMLYENTEWAGGAEKNRKIKDEIYLPPGVYLLHYVTDDSHSFDGWNDDPPRDQKHYGVSIKIDEVK